MAHVDDGPRTAETVVVSGTGSISLSGTTPFGYQTFASLVADGLLTSGDTFSGGIVAADGTWEEGKYTYTTGSVARTTVKNGSSGVNTTVSFAAQSATIFIGFPGMGRQIADAVAKTTPVDADIVPLADSVASVNKLRGTTWANIKATLKTYFDTLYPSGSGTSTGTNTGDQTSVSGNAGTATALQTARTIDGISFNGTANITVIAPATTAATSKATPTNTDEIPLVDNDAAGVLKKLTWTNVKATLKTYFDTLYQAAGSYAPATSGTAILKGNGSGGFSSASSGTDYAPATSGTAILKGNGSGGFSSATAGTDYPPAPAYQEFTSSGTWTKPTGCSFVMVEAWGAGGGGASGERRPIGAANTYVYGGQGGGGGAYATRLFKAADLPSTVSVTIGAGGSGGAAVTTDNTNGSPGSNGGNTSFASTNDNYHLLAYGGGGGGCAQSFSVTNSGYNDYGWGGGVLANGGNGTNYGAPSGQVLSAGSTVGTLADGAFGMGHLNSGYGGGRGGGPSGYGGVSYQGGCGGSGGAAYRFAWGSYGAGGGIGGQSIGGGAGSGSGSGYRFGGAGGATFSTDAGGAGSSGSAGSKSGGGGGGGASTNGNNSGAGGAGGDGFVRVYAW